MKFRLDEGIIKRIKSKKQKKDLIENIYADAKKIISTLFPDWFPTVDTLPKYRLVDNHDDFGYAYVPNFKMLNLKKPLIPQIHMNIELSKELLNDDISIEQIKNTIYHEFAHVLEHYYYIENGMLVPMWSDKINSYYWRRGKDCEDHGRIWRDFANKLNRYAGKYPISKYENAEARKIADEAIKTCKYLVVCTQCQNTIMGFNDSDIDYVNYFKTHDTLKFDNADDSCSFCDGKEFICKVNPEYSKNDYEK